MRGPDRHELARRWHQALQVTRADVFGADDPLRPVYDDPTSILNEQIDVPAIGMVGPAYEAGGPVILSVNGAGGKRDSGSMPSSDRMYAAIEALRADPSLSRFEALNDAVIASIPDWGVGKQHVMKICEALGRRLEEISYLYAVPFRRAGDAGSQMDRSYVYCAYNFYLQELLNTLAPSLVVAIDRPSEEIACHYAENDAQHMSAVRYYTRKRDAHAERREKLEKLRQGFGQKSQAQVAQRNTVSQESKNLQSANGSNDSLATEPKTSASGSSGMTLSNDTIRSALSTVKNEHVKTLVLHNADHADSIHMDGGLPYLTFALSSTARLCVQARRNWAFVWQGGRFDNDVAYWKDIGAERIRLLKGGAELSCRVRAREALDRLSGSLPDIF